MERIIGTIRREYLDHLFYWNAYDLQRKFDEFRINNMKKLLLVVVICISLAAYTETGSENHANVIIIWVDDLRDWVGYLGGYKGTVYTPNIDRLAKRGMVFLNAQCQQAVCGPTRASIMTGIIARPMANS